MSGQSPEENNLVQTTLQFTYFDNINWMDESDCNHSSTSGHAHLSEKRRSDCGSSRRCGELVLLGLTCVEHDCIVGLGLSVRNNAKMNLVVGGRR